MIDVPELRAAIARKGYSQKQLADKMKLNPKTFYLKMKRGIFGSDEIKKMVDILEINDADVIGIFFS